MRSALCPELPDASAAPAAAARAQSPRVALWAYLLWSSTILVEGPLRGALSAIGVPNLLYARDLVVAASVVLALALPLTTRARFAPGLVLMAWLLAVHLCIGLLLGGTAFQRLFGLKIFLPMLWGVAVFASIQHNMAPFLRATAVFFGVSTVGVFINHFVGAWPWEGLSYETAFGAVETTRQWWMDGGTRRLPGFARASFDAAMIIGLTGVVLLATARSIWLRLVVAGVGLAAIVMTTSKGMVIAFVLAALWLALANRSASSLRIGKGIVVLLLLCTCLVPALFLFISVPLQPPDISSLLTSLWDRFAWMWPNAYDLLPDGYGALTGVGPGGIGTALDRPDEIWLPNSADSIFVYFYVTFGLAGIAYLAFPLMAILGSPGGANGANGLQSFAWAGLLIIAYGYGLSINMIEQPFFASVFGLLYGAAFAAVSGRRRS